ncbi:hypothetical protein Nos7107_2687 [Nostoc sp. PCC 7107]|nr:hypothetical protein Nos7107_2687 [Nostoc sp. PCC 7107]
MQVLQDKIATIQMPLDLWLFELCKLFNLASKEYFTDTRYSKFAG